MFECSEIYTLIICFGQCNMARKKRNIHPGGTLYFAFALHVDSIDAKLVDRKQTAKIELNQFKTHVVRQKVDGAHVLSKTRSDRCM